MLENNIYSLGLGLSLRKEIKFIELWKNGGFVFRRDIDTRAKSPEFRMLIVELSQDSELTKSVKLSKNNHKLK